jgi:fructose-bisphosphate aldolase class 1
MTSDDLESVALTLVAKGKGILAADETVPTLTKRFNTLGIQSTEQSRRTYREMLFTSPSAAEFISGVIMYEAGQSALYHRASCNGAASVGKYTDDMELQSVSADDPPHRRDWRDD